jgi:hypothetical protein
MNRAELIDALAARSDVAKANPLGKRERLQLGERLKLMGRKIAAHCAAIKFNRKPNVPIGRA